jgi:O-antigen/teichoic acid export membrane protein
MPSTKTTAARFGNVRVKRGLLHFFIGKSISAGAGLLAMLLVVHGLSITDFANYSVLVALVEVFTAISGLGLSLVILRYVPELYVSFQASALRFIILTCFSLRSVVLVGALGCAWLYSDIISSWIGLGGAVQAFAVFLVVVALRSTNQFLSQILDSTLHQGTAQFAFSVIAIGRCVGMLWLIENNRMILVDVIWIEAICETCAMCVMLFGIFATLWSRQSYGNENIDNGWQHTNRRQVIRFAIAAYLQHLATLPFGGNTNRLVGGVMFSSLEMASFGFSLTLYEYAKRYLPTQLLIGVIRPIVVSRYTTTRNFSVAAGLCEQVLQFNLVLLAGMLAVLLESGEELLGFISGGKYVGDSIVLLCVLLVLLALETQRVLIGLLAEMVEHNEILIPSNLFLSLSVFGGVAGYGLIGAVAFPLANLLALFIANCWTSYMLAKLGFRYAHDWTGTGWSIVVFVLSLGAGKLSQYSGADWIISLVVTLVVFILLFMKIRFRPTRLFVRELIGEKV